MSEVRESAPAAVLAATMGKATGTAQRGAGETRGRRRRLVRLAGTMARLGEEVTRLAWVIVLQSRERRRAVEAALLAEAPRPAGQVAVRSRERRRAEGVALFAEEASPCDARSNWRLYTGARREC